MPPAKRRQTPTSLQQSKPNKKRISKIEREEFICKQRLDAFEREETQIKADRFSLEEKQTLLEAYNEHGFNIFQDTKKLHQYFPNRKESDLKPLIQRLRSNLLDQSNDNDPKLKKPIDEWISLCNKMLGPFARDKKVNLDESIADALIEIATGRMTASNQGSTSSCEPTESIDSTCDNSDDTLPNFPKLLVYFSQLLRGTFPDKLSPVNAQISTKLFRHINDFVDSYDLSKPIGPLREGTWLSHAAESGHKRQDEALKGLQKIDGLSKKCPSIMDIEKDKEIEALCLELPKIKRITDVLNPLHINESLVGSLMGTFSETST